MLDFLLSEIPKLANGVVGAEVEGEGTYDISKTGAADAAREVGKTAKKRARSGAGQAKRGARQARKVPGVTRAEGQVKGAVASAEDLPIARYDKLTADEIASRLNELSQIDLGKVEVYERRHDSRTTVLAKVESLRGSEPWPGYDELTASDVEKAIAQGDDDRVAAVLTYERSHKNRATVLKAAERERASA
jgi:hypothetical protein